MAAALKPVFGVDAGCAGGTARGATHALIDWNFARNTLKSAGKGKQLGGMWANKGRTLTRGEVGWGRGEHCGRCKQQRGFTVQQYMDCTSTGASPSFHSPRAWLRVYPGLPAHSEGSSGQRLPGGHHTAQERLAVDAPHKLSVA